MLFVNLCAFLCELLNGRALCNFLNEDTSNPRLLLFFVSQLRRSFLRMILVGMIWYVC